MIGLAGAADSRGSTADEVAALAAALRPARQRLSRRPAGEILATLETVVMSWLDENSRWRREAERELPSATGFSPEMVRFALPWMLEALRPPGLGALLDAELGDGRVLDDFGGRHARGPGLILHIVPGNLPALAAVPVVLSLAIKSSALIKAGSGDRVFPALFARSLAEVDADLGACIAACYWRGGDRTVEAAAFAAADLVVASGDDATLAEIRARCSARFIGHGHKISFAVIDAEVLRSSALTAAAATGLALDVAIWDQRGCLSPQLCFVEGHFDQASSFAHLLAGELDRLSARLPSGDKSVEEHVAIRRFRAEAEWAAPGRQRPLLLGSGATTDWTVVVEPHPVFRPTPLGRSLRILPLQDLSQLPPLLEPVRSSLEGAGRAVAPGREAKLDQLLAAAGVHHIAPLGAMQRPTLSWKQGGRPRVADWVSWSGEDESGRR